MKSRRLAYNLMNKGRILKIACLAVPLYLVLAGAVSFSQDSCPEDDHYMKGVDHAAKGDFADAGVEFKEALRIDPFLFYAATAEKIAQDAVDGKVRKETATRIFKGIDYANKDDLAAAIGELNQAIVDEPNYAPSYNERGIIYDLEGNHEEAILDFTKVIEIGSHHDYAYNNRGYVYVGMGFYDKAVADFTKAIEVNPNYTVAYYNRGCVYGAQNRMYDDAIADLTKAVEINPKYGNAYLDRGICYMCQGKYDEAFADMNKAIEINPKNIRAHWNKAQCLEEAGRTAEAIEAYKYVMQNAPTGPGYIAEAESKVRQLIAGPEGQIGEETVTVIEVPEESAVAQKADSAEPKFNYSNIRE